MSFLSSEIVRIRKPHDCWGCGTAFQPGSLMERCTGVDVQIQTCYFCASCLAYCNAIELGGEGILQNEFRGDPDYLEFIAELRENEKVFSLTTAERRKAIKGREQSEKVI